MADRAFPRFDRLQRDTKALLQSIVSRQSSLATQLLATAAWVIGNAESRAMQATYNKEQA